LQDVDSSSQPGRRSPLRRLISAASTVFSLLLSLALPAFFVYLVYLGKLWGFWWAVLVLIVVLAAGIACLLLISSLLPWIESRAPCPHGARVGSSRRDCPECEIAEIRTQERQRTETAHRDRSEFIRKEALALRAREIKRLSAAWLTEASAYLAMTPRQFEDAIAELFRRLGYEVKQTPFSNDGGKDAIAWKDGRKFLIECKRFAADKSVGRRDVQILHSAVVDSKAEQGFYVTTGSYARTAVAYAKNNNLKIYDHAAIPWLVSQAYGPSQVSSSAEVMCHECGATISLPLGESTPSGTCKNGHEVLMNIALSDLGVAHLHEPAVPTCPRCGSQMQRLSRFGRRFWGCSKFPMCRGRKPITGR
jgi:hypothetical protein